MAIFQKWKLVSVEKTCRKVFSYCTQNTKKVLCYIHFPKHRDLSYRIFWKKSDTNCYSICFAEKTAPNLTKVSSFKESIICLR